MHTVFSNRKIPNKIGSYDYFTNYRKDIAIVGQNEIQNLLFEVSSVNGEQIKHFFKYHVEQTAPPHKKKFLSHTLHYSRINFLFFLETFQVIDMVSTGP